MAKCHTGGKYMSRISTIVCVRSFDRITVKISTSDRISTIGSRLYVYVPNSKELNKTRSDIAYALLGGKHDYSISSGKDSVVFSRI